MTQLAPKVAVLCEITRNDGHRAVQGHSRSPILILMERQCGLMWISRFVKSVNKHMVKWDVTNLS